MSSAWRSILIWLTCTAACGCTGVSVGEDGDGTSPCRAEALVPVADPSVPVGDFDRSPEELFAQIEGTARGTLDLYEEVDGDLVFPGARVSLRIAIRPLLDSLQLVVSEPSPDAESIRCPDDLEADAELDIDIDNGAQLRVRDRATLSIYTSTAGTAGGVDVRVLDGFETDLVAYFPEGAVPGEDAALLGRLSLDDSGSSWNASFLFRPLRACRPDDYECRGGMTIEGDREEAPLGEGSARIEGNAVDAER